MVAPVRHLAWLSIWGVVLLLLRTRGNQSAGSKPPRPRIMSLLMAALCIIMAFSACAYCSSDRLASTCRGFQQGISSSSKCAARQAEAAATATARARQKQQHEQQQVVQ